MLQNINHQCNGDRSTSIIKSCRSIIVVIFLLFNLSTRHFIDAFLPIYTPSWASRSRVIHKLSHKNKGGLIPISSLWKKSSRVISLSSETLLKGGDFPLSSEENEEGNFDENNSINRKIMDLSHYRDLRSFNLALESIAIECQYDTSINSKKASVDVIGRATVAEALFRKLDQEFSRDTISFRPDLVTYNTLLKIWAKTAQTLAQGRGRGDVQAVLHAMDDVPEDLLVHINGIGGITTARDAALHASSILNELESLYLRGESYDIIPDEQTYNIVMDAWCKCGAKDSSKRTDEILEKMLKWSTNGVESSLDKDGEELIHVNGDVSKWEQIHPDSISYSICIESLGRSGASLEKISSLLQSVEKNYEMKGHRYPSLKPNIRVANSAILAYSKVRPNTGKDRTNAYQKGWDSLNKANSIFKQWNQKYIDTGDEDYKPDATSFTALIDAYSKIGDVVATEKAEKLFNSMEEEWVETGDNRIKPTSKTFAVLASAWAKIYDSRSPEKIEQLLEHQNELFLQDIANGVKNSNLKPFAGTFTTAINAWARSRDNTKPQRSLRILKRVIAMYKKSNDPGIKPSLFMYNAVITACAKCRGTPEQMNEALKIAFAVNKAIAAVGYEQNHVTYASLINAAYQLVPPGPERNDIVTAVFEKAKKSGHVDKSVLKNLQVAADRDLFYDLLPTSMVIGQYGNVNFDDIPFEWSKRVSYLL